MDFRTGILYFDFKTRLEENKGGDVERHTGSCEWRTALFHAKRLQKIFSLGHLEIYVGQQQQQEALFCMAIQVHTVLRKLF